jgi:hypothetical protein
VSIPLASRIESGKVGQLEIEMPIKKIIWTPDYVETCQFHDCDDRENLRFDSVDEYVDDHLANGVIESVDELLASDAHFTVYGFDRMVPDREECEFLDELIERIDDERCDPSGDYDPIRHEELEKLRELESKFIDEFLKVYKPWACESVAEIKVPFRAWFNNQSESYRDMLRKCGAT